MNPSQLFKPNPPIQDVYFGCHRQCGHYFWWPRMQSGERDIHHHFENPYQIDGGFTPKEDLSEGAVALHHYPNYTIFGFHDNTVDRRPGSHSTFVLHHSTFAKPPLILEDCLARARDLFPEVMARHTRTAFRLAEEHWHGVVPPIPPEPIKPL